MSAFREDYSIKALRLIRLWVAEGFLKPIQGKIPEEAAEEHLNALIDRNLISVRQGKSTEKVKFLGIHDLLRDLCMVNAREKKFFHVINGRIDHNISQDMLCLRRLLRVLEMGFNTFPKALLRIVNLRFLACT